MVDLLAAFEAAPKNLLHDDAMLQKMPPAWHILAKVACAAMWRNSTLPIPILFARPPPLSVSQIIGAAARASLPAILVRWRCKPLAAPSAGALTLSVATLRYTQASL